MCRTKGFRCCALTGFWQMKPYYLGVWILKTLLVSARSRARLPSCSRDALHLRGLLVWICGVHAKVLRFGIFGIRSGHRSAAE